jgi:hypothetical protein
MDDERVESGRRFAGSPGSLSRPVSFAMAPHPGPRDPQVHGHRRSRHLNGLPSWLDLDRHFIEIATDETTVLAGAL